MTLPPPSESPSVWLLRQVETRPLIPLTLVVLAGAGSSGAASPLPTVTLACVGVAAYVVMVLSLAAGRLRPAAGWALLWLPAFMIASLRAAGAGRAPADDVSVWTGSEAVVEGVVASPPEVTLAGARLTVDCRRIQVRGRAAACTGRLQVLLATPPSGRVGDLIRCSGKVESPAPATNPRQFSYRSFLSHQRIWAVMRQPEIEIGAPVVESVWERGRRWGVDMRAHIYRRLADTMPPPYPSQTARLMCSMLYGMRAAPLPPLLERDFRRTGTIHILVVSGTQVAILMGSLLWLCRCLHLPTWPTILLNAAALVGYTWITGYDPPIARAAVIGAVALVALLLHRSSDYWSALAFAALALVFVCPGQLFHIGFQLSFAACAGLIALGQPLGKLLERCLPALVATPLALTFAAQLFVAPVLLHHFGQISAIALLANPFAILLAAVLLYTSGLAALLAGFAGPAAVFVNHLNHGLVDLLVRGVHLGAAWPFALIHVSYLSLWGVTIAYALLMVAAVGVEVSFWDWFDWERWAVRLLVAVTIGMAVFTWHVTHPSQKLTITWLDVGQGSCAVIRSPSGRVAVIDCGTHDQRLGDVGERVLAPYLMSHGIRCVDVVIVSHADEDHVNGLPALLRAAPVKVVLDASMPTQEAPYQQLLAVIERCGITRRPLRRGVTIQLGAGVRLQTLSPTSTPLRGTDDDENNNSAVLRLTYRKFSALFPADIHTAAELQLVKREPRLQSTVVTAPHHGSDSSSSPLFVRRVKPEVCVVSVGRSHQFGHPAGEVLARWRATGARIYRTDQDGAITLTTDGEQVNITTYGER